MRPLPRLIRREPGDPLAGARTEGDGERGVLCRLGIEIREADVAGEEQPVEVTVKVPAELGQTRFDVGLQLRPRLVGPSDRAAERGARHVVEGHGTAPGGGRAGQVKRRTRNSRDLVFHRYSMPASAYSSA